VGRLGLDVALALLGIGWNLGLVSGTAIITDAVPLATRARTQGAVDLCIAVAGAGGGMGSGLESGGGNGLRNMTHRAEQLGGSAHISRPADGGTLLEWVVPLQA
jgi:signal transduction histidine kinase